MIRALVFASALVLVGGGAAVAVPGLDPAPRDPVKIMFQQKLGDGVRFTFDSVPFVPANPGWDFGDREAYSCAFMEYMDTTPSVLAYVEFERIDGLTQPNGSPYVIVIDKGDGPETSDGNPPGPGALQTGAACGTVGHGGAVFDGSDHFPHFTTMHPGGLHFLDAATGVEFAALSLTRGECNKAYYSPGNEAGEAILWCHRSPDHPRPEDRSRGRRSHRPSRSEKS
ncbi:MAG: hypothetical protein ACRDIC_20440 [bacterium]